MREGQYWEEEERKSCRICEGGIESWEHVWEGCGGGRGQEGESWQEAIEWVLGEEGEREDWIGIVEELRRREGREEGGQERRMKG